MRNQRFLRSLCTTLTLTALGLSGSSCAVFDLVYNPHPKPAPQVKIDTKVQPLRQSEYTTQGSIYTRDFANPFSDDKAHRRGDLVLVKVSQTSKGSKSASTDTSRDSSISASAKYLGGLEDRVNNTYVKRNPTAKPGTSSWDPTNLIESQSSNSFKGAGSTVRDDSLTATVSAVVTDVMENGDLEIYGHQTVTVNNEASVLTVQGIVRPADLGVDNTVDSSRIADARIEFSGSGVVTDKQHPGWGMRAFDWIWPF